MKTFQKTEIFYQGNLWTMQSQIEYWKRVKRSWCVLRSHLCGIWPGYSNSIFHTTFLVSLLMMKCYVMVRQVTANWKYW